MKSPSSLSLLCAALLTAACSSSNSVVAVDAPSADASADVASDVTSDVTSDASVDVAPDVTADVAPDVTPDVAPDVTPDVAPDVTPDVAPDVTADVAPDVTPDVAPDVAPDVVVDAGPTCGVGQTVCGAVCATLSRDPLNCGACGRACASGEVCDAGSCALRCPTGQLACSGVCRDVSVDVANCGACGNACAAGSLCSMGTCMATCGSGLSLCSGLCRDTRNDPANCGACGTACAAGQACVAGACVSPCGAGLSLCSGACVDRSTSNSNCGTCGNVCATGRSCVAGVCAVVCPAGQTACGDACVSLQSSASNCGVCGRACTSGQVCASGVCTVVMATPFAASIHDHQVSRDGTQAIIGRSGNDLLLRCARADGSLVRPDQVVATSANFDMSGSATQVRIGGRSNTVAVTWMVLETAGMYSTRQYYARVYDNACEPVTTGFRWPSSPSGEYVPDVAMTNDGRFVVAWKQDDINVGFFSARGVLEGQLTFATRAVCSGGGYALHVAVNPETGDGVMTCQQHQSNPIYYQRFAAARTLLDPTPVRITQTDAGHSAWYESHVVGMNADGAFAIEWQDATARTYVANFYDRTGALTRTATLGAIPESLYFDGFRQTHQAVELLGADFVLRSGQYSSPSWAWRYNAAGTRLGCATVPASAGPIHTLRANAASTLSTASGTSVRVNPVSLADTSACP